MGEGETMDILETMAVLDLKVKGNFLTLTRGHLNIKIMIMVFSEITGHMKVKFYVEPPCLGKTKF